MDVVVDYVFLGFIGTVVVGSLLVGGLLLGLALHGRRQQVAVVASRRVVRG